MTPFPATASAEGRQINGGPSPLALPVTPASPTPAKPMPGAVAENTLRVHVKLLDSLMTLAGELVLTRNQLLRAVGALNQPA